MLYKGSCRASLPFVRRLWQAYASTTPTPDLRGMMQPPSRSISLASRALSDYAFARILRVLTKTSFIVPLSQRPKFYKIFPLSSILSSSSASDLRMRITSPQSIGRHLQISSPIDVPPSSTPICTSVP